MAGCWYHVTTRGNERHEIYWDDRDREKFIELAGELGEQFGVRVHGFVLMDNHFHLLVETTEGNLSRAMQWLNVSYSVWFNRRHQRSGHLFQGRFGSVVLEEGTAVAVSQYVHLNPVRLRRLGLDKAAQARAKAGIAPAGSGNEPGADAKLVAERLERLRGYRWSSYRAYVGLAERPGWLVTELVLGMTGGGGARVLQEQQRRYRADCEAAVRDGLRESPWERLEAGILLGGTEFVARMRKLLKGDVKEQTAVRQLRERPSFSQVVALVAAVRGEEWSRFRDRYGDWGRDAVMWLARKRSGMKLQEVGTAVGGIDYRSVGTAVRRFEARMQREPDLAEAVRAMETKLKNGEM